MKDRVVETVEVSSRDGADKILNPYLRLGWVLVADWIVDFGEPEHRIETAHFLLGWTDHSRPPVHPKES